MKSEKKLDINIDPEEAILSIPDTFRANGALSRVPWGKKLNDPPVSLVLKYVPSYVIVEVQGRKVSNFRKNIENR